MTVKRAKPQPASSRKKSPDTKGKLPERPTKTAPASRREGPENLRRRAEWFLRRRGGAKA